MKTQLLLIFICFSFTYSIGQDVQFFRAKKNRLVTITPYDNGNILMYELSGLFEKAKRIEYVDTLNGYRLDVPKWLRIRETNKLNQFGGTFPEVDSVENAIAIVSFPKKNFSSFQSFKKFVVEDSSYLEGTSPSWSDNHVWKRIENIDTNENKSYVVMVNFYSKTYKSQYRLLETEESYIWVNFTATEETYDINLSRFYELMEGFENLEKSR